MESVVELVADNCGCTIIVIAFISSFVFYCTTLLVQRLRNSFKEQNYIKPVTVNQNSAEKSPRNTMSSAYSSTFSSVSRNQDVDRRCRSAGLITSYPCSSPRMLRSNGPSSFEGEDFDTGANLDLEKLQIRPPEENSLRNRSFSPQSSYGSPGMMNSTLMRGEQLMPLWKDYPMVHKAVPSSYSYCSMPLSSYPNSGYGLPTYSPPNYRSSSMATIFGGPKPIISPPKLDVGFASRYEFHPSPTPAYPFQSSRGRHSWIYGLPAENSMPPYLSSPLSRSSSQSSGFVSQKEFNTPPPSSPSSPPPSNSNVAFGDQDFHSELHIGTDPPRIGSFHSGDFASFSSLKGCGSATTSEMNLRQGRIWSAPAFITNLRSNESVNSVSGNTCSRFARKETATGSCLRRLNDLSSASSSLFSEDEDEVDEASFVSARTSMTHRTKTGSSRPASAVSNDFVRSKSKIRSGPSIRNLRSRSSLEEESVRSGKRGERLQGQEPKTQDIKRCASLWSLMLQLFWSLSLFLNIVIMFWFFFGSPYDAQESHWLHHLIHNVTDIVVTTTPIIWDSLQKSFLDMLAAREVGTNPTVLIINDYEL